MEANSRAYLTLDGLRGVAALCIVVLHCNRYLGDFTWSAAALAVDLFFVLSGFVLSHAYDERFRAGLTAWGFTVMRVIRFYPLYLLGTALGLVEAVLVIHYQQGAIEWTWDKFWYSLPFALLMLPAPGQSALFPFNGVMWSIFFELLINIVWAVFWRPLQSMRVLIWVIALSGVGLVASVFWWQTMWLGANWENLVGGLFRVSYSYFLGVLLYRLHRGIALPKLHPILFLAALPALLFLPMSLPVKLMIALFVLPWFVLLGAQVEPKGLLALGCRKLGAASYAIYTVHKRLYLLSYAALLQLFAFDAQLYAPWVGILFMASLVAGCILVDRFYDVPIRRALGVLRAPRHPAAAP